MKVYFEVPDVGFVGDDGMAFIVGAGIVKDKKGKERAKQPVTYYVNLIQALRELHERMVIKKMSKSPEGKSLSKFISRMEELEKEWYGLVKSKLILPDDKRLIHKARNENIGV